VLWNEELATYVGRDDLAAAVSRLGAWDRRMDMDAHAAALFRVWYVTLIRSTIGDDLGLLFDAVGEIQPIILEKVTVLAHEDSLPTLLDGDRAALMLAALDDALTYLDERAVDLGVDEAAWSDLHVAAFDRDYVTYFDFDYGDDTVVPWGGDATSINVAECFFWEGSELADQCVGNHGPIFRAVASFDGDGTPRYRYAWPFGHTGEASDWIDGTYAELPFKRDEVETRTADVRVLEP
jgi:acyl-homoserine lactone acylase PvdQ